MSHRIRASTEKLTEQEVLSRLHPKLTLLTVIPFLTKSFRVKCKDCGKETLKNYHTIKQRCSCDKMADSRKSTEEYLTRLNPDLTFVKREGKIFYCKCHHCNEIIRKWNNTLHKRCMRLATEYQRKPEHLKKPKKRYPSNPNFYRDVIKPRIDSDLSFKIKLALRSRLKAAIKDGLKGKGKKAFSSVKDLGCEISYFIKYIENKFYDNPLTGEKMSWDNWSRAGWHLDHIRPLCSFDLSNPEEGKKASHYTNLQPMWAFQNLKKSGKNNE